MDFAFAIKNAIIFVLTILKNGPHAVEAQHHIDAVNTAYDVAVAENQVRTPEQEKPQE